MSSKQGSEPQSVLKNEGHFQPGLGLSEPPEICQVNQQKNIQEIQDVTIHA